MEKLVSEKELESWASTRR